MKKKLLTIALSLALASTSYGEEVTEEVIQAEIDRLMREKQVLEEYIFDAEEDVAKRINVLLEENRIKINNYLVLQANMSKDYATGEDEVSATVAISREIIDTDMNASAKFRVGARAYGSGYNVIFGEAGAVKKDEAYEVSGNVGVDHHGNAAASAVGVVDIYENDDSGVSLIGGVRTGVGGPEPVFGVEVVGRETGVGITPFGINVVERVGENGEYRRRYSTNPIMIVLAEAQGQRSALDVIGDQNERTNHRISKIGIKAPYKIVSAVDSAELKSSFWTKRGSGTLFVDHNGVSQWYTNGKLNKGLELASVDMDWIENRNYTSSSDRAKVWSKKKMAIGSEKTLDEVMVADSSLFIRDDFVSEEGTLFVDEQRYGGKK